ncbi:uncharacterized protein LOC121718462 [Alosa sapidissima]|uniref:uncharacterized protein LOC121718462 n=1 Tax=Alosa sapidissima TaxID=34773 RepID=UPI001C09ECBB|nr:uncharacterized protein LOC121718462 [Alosa sapidissima]
MTTNIQIEVHHQEEKNSGNPNVDECSERPDICGAGGSASCSNTIGSFHCTCNEGYIPCKAWNASSPEICKAAAEMVDEIFDKGRQGQVLHADDLFRSTESLIAELVQPTVHHHVTNIITNSTEVHIVSVGPNASRSGLSHLTTTDVTLEIDLHGIAKNYNGSASVALVVYNNMEEVLNASLFRSDDHTVKNTMMSKVVSVISP